MANAKIESEDEGFYLYKDDEGSFTVCIYCACGMVTLKTDDYTQVFVVHARESAKEVLTDLKSMSLEKAALVNKGGIVNKRKFLDSIQELAKKPDPIVKKEDIPKLEAFILKRLNMEPETVRMQLIIEGYESIADVVDFEDPHPDYVKSYNDMRKFIRAIQL